MSLPLFFEDIRPNGVAWVTLTRPDVHNAFNDRLIALLAQTLRSLDADERVRVVVLAARGRSFSAGADLNWMQSMAGFDEERNAEDARELADLMATLANLRKPTLALVQGPAYGGGVGLVACCDIALASESASFSLTEVRLGLIPAVISPYVVSAMGARAARRYFLTGEKFSVWEAQRLGLVHEVVAPGELESRGRVVIDAILKGGPQALMEAKSLIDRVAEDRPTEELREETAKRIARIRVSDEGREGIAAFLEKRKAQWCPD